MIQIKDILASRDCYFTSSASCIDCIIRIYCVQVKLTPEFILLRLCIEVIIHLPVCSLTYYTVNNTFDGE